MSTMIFSTRWSFVGVGCVLLLGLGLAGCDAGSSIDVPIGSDNCIVPTARFADGGVGKDDIPSLTDPNFISASEATFLEGSNRVIGLVIDGQALAVPHNILWWHEIINFNFPNHQLAVSFCPLTGSSLAFDRAAVGGGEFGVSGLLFQNNLTMYDRTNDESLWPQMNREAGCGPRSGSALPMVAVMEMTWEGWRALHPGTRVVSNVTGFLRNYGTSGYPYGNYEDPDNGALLFPMPIDGQRPPKERVLGIPDGEGGIAFPFFELDEVGAPYRAVHEVVGGLDVVIFWDHDKEGAMAFRPRAGSQDLTFEARPDGIFDTQTDSRWRLDGVAVEGLMAGEQLEPVAEAFVAFWFAWAAFQPSTRVWEAPTQTNDRLYEGG